MTRPSAGYAPQKNDSSLRGQLIHPSTKGASCQPKGCRFESCSRSQIYPLRVLSAVWLTTGELALLEMANTRGNHLSPDVRTAGRIRHNGAPGV